MINRYVVYSVNKDTLKDDKTLEDAGWKMQVETDSLETAMDFAEFYRLKFPDCYFQIRGISYNRTGVKEGQTITEWEPVPAHQLKREITDFMTIFHQSI